MVQAISERISTRTTIQTAEGPVMAHFQRIPETGALVLSEYLERGPDTDPRPYPAGTIFVPNRQLAAETDGRAEYMAYTGGLYEAWRGSRHTVLHSGAEPRAEHGEVQLLEEDVRRALAGVNARLASGLLKPNEEKRGLRQQRQLVCLLEKARNAHKVTARALFTRGLEVHDALGRRNPMAAAMASGGGIAHMKERRAQVFRIAGRVENRATHVWGALDVHLRLYRELREELKTRQDRRPPGLLMLLTQPRRGPGAMRRVIQILMGYAQALENVHALPFHRNAFHTREDLLCAVQLAEQCQNVALVNHYLKIRQGITWVLAQSALEMEVIAPLSFLIEDLHTAERHRRRDCPGPRKAVRITWSHAPARFRSVKQSLINFLCVLMQCVDDDLKVPVKQEVAGLASEALDAMHRDDWQKAKRLLKQSSALM